MYALSDSITNTATVKVTDPLISKQGGRSPNNLSTNTRIINSYSLDSLRISADSEVCSEEAEYGFDVCTVLWWNAHWVIDISNPNTHPFPASTGPR